MNATTTPTTRIWCDGSCLRNPGPGGFGVWISADRWLAGGEQSSTNNRMELAAVLAALQQVQGPVELICDSKYVIDALTKWRFGWRKRNWHKGDGSPVLNADIIRQLDAALNARHGQVTFTWVRGHTGDHGNEAADTIARAYAEALAGGRVPNPGPGL